MKACYVKVFEKKDYKAIAEQFKKFRYFWAETNDGFTTIALCVPEEIDEKIFQIVDPNLNKAEIVALAPIVLPDHPVADTDYCPLESRENERKLEYIKRNNPDLYDMDKLIESADLSGGKP